MLPKEAKDLIKTEMKNLISIRKKIRQFFLGTITGGAMQVLRMKKELEDVLYNEILLGKIYARKEGKKYLGDIGSFVPDTTEKDIVLSHIAATSYANSWATAILSETPFNSDSRLRRIVTTETARSFSDPAMEAADTFQLSRVWNAVLDSKTCKLCASLDGEETLPGETFKNGYEPGWVHPNCRCFSTLILSNNK